MRERQTLRRFASWLETAGYVKEAQGPVIELELGYRAATWALSNIGPQWHYEHRDAGVSARAVVTNA